MTLPRYADWKEAVPALHQAAQILNAARLASLPPMPNALRHSLRPIPTGATSGPLGQGVALTLDYAQGTILIQPGDDREIMPVSLNGSSQESLFNTVFAGLAQTGHPIDADRSKITHRDPFDLDLTQAKLYAEVQWRMFQMLAVVKASMFGPQNPLVLWPHGFDLSTLWFVDGMVEEADAHLNFGFSPGTSDVGQPYVYFYAYPALNDLRSQLPDLVTWATGWHSPGGYITYERFANESQPEQMLAELMIGVLRQASEMLRTA
jgi:Family of unknown function (DUF5996)